MLQVNNRVLIRAHEPADAAELFEVVDRNRLHLRNFITWIDSTQKPEDSLNFIRSAQQSLHDQQGMAMGIFMDGRLIGGIGMHHWDHALRKAEMGYWIAKEAEGKGIMYETAGVFLSYLFGQLNLNKVELRFKKENLRSARLAERLQFRVEGILRDSLLMNGTLQDVVVAGLLRRER